MTVGLLPRPDTNDSFIFRNLSTRDAYSDGVHV